MRLINSSVIIFTPQSYYNIPANQCKPEHWQNPLKVKATSVRLSNYFYIISKLMELLPMQASIIKLARITGGDNLESKLMHLLAEKQDNREETALVTITASDFLNCRPGAMLVVDQYGQVRGDIEDELLQEIIGKEALLCISKGLSRKISLDLKGGSLELFINALCYKDRLIIVGSGNLVLDIYRMAQIVGYQITIIDSHAETLTRERFPQADQLLLGNAVQLLSSCLIDEKTSIIIASHHHEWDQAALQAVIASPARYVGVLGNKRKVTSYLSNLNLMDISEEWINRVHMPIGLDLGGQRTSEIALAVMAEIQAVKYHRSGGFTTTKYGKRDTEKREALY
jgi:xanthine dehydrogenase accessory factor